LLLLLRLLVVVLLLLEARALLRSLVDVDVERDPLHASASHSGCCCRRWTCQGSCSSDGLQGL
jgi:hypothetical protein